MRMSEGVEWAIHCCTVLALLPSETALPGARLAEFHEVPAAYLAKSLQALTRAEITESIPGRRGGFRLARPAEDISLLDITLAVEGDENAFRCTEIRRRGPCRMPTRSYTHTCSIASAMWRAEAAWRAELAATSIAQIVAELAQTISPQVAARSATWLQEVLS